MESIHQTDSIFMSVLRSVTNETHTRIRSITGPIEFLSEASKFYELAVLQINTTLQLITQKPNDQIPETSRTTMISNLMELKDSLHGHLNNTKCLISEKDKVLTDTLGLDFESRSRSLHVPIEQMKSDIDMFKEKLDFAFEKIYRTELAVQGFDQDAIVARLMQEQQIKSTLETMTIEEHYMVLLNNCYKGIDQDYDMETKVTDDIFKFVLIEIMKDMRIRLELDLQKTQSEICIVFIQLVSYFQDSVNEKLRANLSRLDEVKQRVDSLSRLAVSVRKEELVYKKAFARRCENLLLAETEVDLLGDQVEALQDILDKIYLVLEQNSSVLSHNFQVMDILKMIKNCV